MLEKQLGDLGRGKKVRHRGTAELVSVPHTFYRMPWADAKGDGTWEDYVLCSSTRLTHRQENKGKGDIIIINESALRHSYDNLKWVH